MKILLVSDNHCEFSKEVYIPTKLQYQDFDVCVLAGDFDTYEGIAKGSLEKFCKILHPKPVIYITGNHEYYSKYSFEYINEQLIYISSKIDNLHYLNNDHITLNGYNFFGGTMWSPLHPTNPVIVGNDTIIKIKGSLMDSSKMISLYNNFYNKITCFFDNHKDEKNIVISHFVPLLELNNKNFPILNNYDEIVLHYFNVDLKHFILEQQPLAWFYGHNHYSDSINVNKTLVASSQVCYPFEYLKIGSCGFDIFEV